MTRGYRGIGGSCDEFGSAGFAAETAVGKLESEQFKHQHRHRKLIAGQSDLGRTGLQFGGCVAAVVAVAFGAACSPVGGKGTAKIDELQSTGVGSDDDVRWLNIAMCDLQTAMQMTDSMGNAIDQPNGLCGLDRRPAAFANVLKVIGQADAFCPRQRDVNLMTIFLPLHGSRKAIILEPTQDSQQLLGRPPDRQRLDQEKAAARATERIEGEIRFAKRTAHAFQQKVVSATDATALKTGDVFALDEDRESSIVGVFSGVQHDI